MAAGEKLLRNPYERGPTLYREDLLDPDHPVRDFQIYDNLNGVKTIVYEGHVDHFEDEAGVLTTDLSKAYYVVAISEHGNVAVDSSELGHIVRENSFVAGWDQEQYWLEVDKLFRHIRYKVCRPLSE